jgi:ankyrin repeat protein
VELNMRDVWDSTPLYYSCLYVCRYLTEHKEVELNMRDVWDSTPLYYACLCGHKELVEYLLNRWVDFQYEFISSLSLLVYSKSK